MKKLTIFAVRKDDRRQQFVFKKEQAFIPVIRKLIKYLTGKNDEYLLTTCDEKSEEQRDISSKDVLDQCMYRKYGDYEFDIFIGAERIILVMRASQKNQAKVSKKISSVCEWPKKVASIGKGVDLFHDHKK